MVLTFSWTESTSLASTPGCFLTSVLIERLAGILMTSTSAMRGSGFVSLRTKLVRMLLAAVAVPVVLISASITFTVDRLVRSNGAAVLGEIADQISARISDYLSDVRSTTLYAAYGEPIQNYLTATSTDDSEVLPELMRIVESKHRTFAAYLYGSPQSDRDPVIVSLLYSAPVDYQYEPATDPFIVGLFERSTPFGFVDTRIDRQVIDAAEPSFFIYRIVHDLRDGRPIGVLVVAIPFATVAEAFGSIVESRNAELLILAADGRTIYPGNHPKTTVDPDMVGGRRRTYREGKRIVAIRSLSGADATVALSAPQSRLSLSSGIVSLGLLLPIAVVLAVAVILAIYLPSRISSPIVALARETEHIRDGDFVVRARYASNDEIGELYSAFTRMTADLDSLLKRVTTEEKRRAQAELQALQSQITPHFVFNTLNTVKWLARLQGADSIVDVTDNLMSMMRYAVESRDSLVTVADEFENVTQYLRIQEIRFFHSIETQIECAADCRALVLPRMVVQPLVENAFHHAFSELDEGGTLRVTCHRIGDRAEIAVTDSAGALSEETAAGLRAQLEHGLEHGEVSSLHVGIANVHQRVQATFGAHYGVRVRANPGFETAFTIVIPSSTEDALE